MAKEKVEQIADDKPEKPDPSKSVLAQALAGIGQEPPTNEETPEETQSTETAKAEEPPVEDKKPEENQEEDESQLDSIDINKLTGRTGQPISTRAKEQFDKLAASRKRYVEKVKKQEERIKELEASIAKSNGGTEEELTKLKQEVDSYKTKINDLFFVESDEFKTAFQKPISDVINNISRYLGAVDQKDQPELEKLMRQADALLGDPTKEIEYVKLVDKVAEDYLPGSIGARFINETEKLWNLQIKKEEALKDKIKAKEEVTAKLRENSDRGVQAFKDRLGAEVSAFELTGLGKFYLEQNPTLGYKDSIPQRRQLAERVISDFMQTGVVTQDLADVIMHGMFKDVVSNERKWMLDGLNKALDTMKTMEEENKKMKEQLKKLSATDKSGGYNSSRKEDKPKDKNYSALAEALAEISAA